VNASGRAGLHSGSRLASIEPDNDPLDVIASSMNTALLGAVGGDPDVRFLDAFGLLDDVVAFGQ